MSSSRIVCTASIDGAGVEILERVASVNVASGMDEQTLMRHLLNTVGIVCRGEGVVTRNMIEGCPTLRVIGRPGAGYDSVDVSAATEYGIPIVFAPVGGFAVAESVVALLLGLVKQIPLCDQVVKDGRWMLRYEMQPGDLIEHTLGIIGVGRIGAQLAKIALGFGMKILVCDPLMTTAQAGELGVSSVPLEELLRRSDYVSIHTPLNDDTRGLINAKRVSMMKKGAIFINTARGGVVESLDVLADALETGQLAGVGLDVFPQEPPDASHRIFSDPRCLCAPHVLGVSKLAWSRLCISMAEDMVAVLEGRMPKFCVNPQVFP